MAERMNPGISRPPRVEVPAQPVVSLPDVGSLVTQLEEERRKRLSSPSRGRFASTQPSMISQPINPEATEQIIARVPLKPSIHRSMGTAAA